MVVQTPRGPVHAVVEGDGQWMVLIHSVGADLTIWDDVAPALRKQFRVVAYDVRGHGGSKSTYGPMSIPDWSEDLDALLRSLGIERTIIVGLSMGGMIAQTFAARNSAMISNLVLMDTASDYEPEMRRVWEERAQIAERDGMSPLVDPTIARWFTPSFIAHNSESLQRVRRSIAAMDSRHYAEGCRALGALNTSPILHSVTSRTLVVVGEDDHATPKVQSERIAALVPGSELVIIPNAAHCPCVEQPEAVLQTLGRFLSDA